MSTPSSASTQGTSREPPLVSIAELDRDPHSVVRRYRPRTPVIRTDDKSYLVLRAYDVESLVTDPRTRQLETDFYKTRGITEGPLIELFGNSMLLSNGEAHRRRRASMGRPFASRMIAALRPSIREIADELVDHCLADGHIDLLADYASLVPALTLARILGLPEEDVPYFTGLVYSVSRALSVSFMSDEVPALNESADQLLDYSRRLLALRRASPRDDFLTVFLRAVDNEPELSPIEALAQIAIVMIGGSDTTRAGLAIQTALLLQHPEQWRAVCADPALIPGAVLEALRYEPAVGSFPRFSLASIAIEGLVIPAGQCVRLSTLSAMRDPALYADPERFDIKRTDHPRWHMAFGGGVHRCLGEALAKAELEEGLAALTRIPQLRLTEEFRIEGFAGIRRLSRMPVTWS